MAYCSSCGAQVNAGDQNCPYCGAAQVNQTTGASAGTKDDGNIIWGIIGFCFPLVGLILYLVWYNDKPNNAKTAGIGALISVAISFVGGLFAGFLGAF